MAKKRKQPAPRVLSLIQKLEKEVNERVKAAMGLDCCRKEVRDDIAEFMGKFLNDNAAEISEQDKANIELYAKKQAKDFFQFRSEVEKRFVEAKSKVGDDISLQPEYLLEGYHQEDSGSFQVTNEELESALTKILREIRKFEGSSFSARKRTLESLANLLRDEKQCRKSYMEYYVYEFICDTLNLQQHEAEEA